ncbi:PAS domain S-box protein [Paenibacillus sp.]|uniref:bifunctional diguanylate cyclase/phosphodiesterase n=1 Tax=Paenibacillus sp. TaxID=58172 RepID=UPI002D47D3A4|nr:PAS domain S-box protein [Paenibacillus sp.]HZG58466.1 PAS domain S-box protein [Paenibacillus sp.]
MPLAGNMFQTVFHGIADPIAIIELEGDRTFRFAAANRASFDVGFLSEENLGKTIDEMFPPELASALNESYRSAIRERKPVVYDREVETPKGLFIGQISYFPIVEGDECTSLIVIAKDISERKRREAEIERQNLFYESLLNHLNDAVAVAAVDTSILQVNRAFEELFGWTSDELVGRTYENYPFLEPAMLAESDDILRRLRAGENVANHVTRRLRKNGSYVDVSVSFSLIRDGSGELVALAGIYRDITEQKVRERLLEESEQQFKSLFDQNPDAVFAIDRAGRFVSVNPRTVEVTGYAAAELEGMEFAPLIHPEDMPLAFERFHAVLAGERSDMELRIASELASSGYLNMKITTMPMFVNDSIVGLYGVAKDITEIAKAQRELEESEKRYKSLFERHPDAVFSFDREGTIVTFNERTSEISGYPPDRLAGRSIFPFCHPEDVPHTVAHARRALTGEAVTYEVRILHDVTREYFIMQVTNLPIVVNGEIVGVYAIAKDVTPLREAERELRESQQLYKSLFDHNPDGVYTLDREGNFKSFNTAVPSILGFEAEDLHDMSFVPFIHPDDLPATMEHFAAALQGEVQQYEIRAMRHDSNQYNTYTIKNLPIYINGDITGVFGIAKDITDWKRTQQALIDSEERHRQLIELSPDPILVHREGRLLFWNCAAARCFRATDARSFADVAVSDLIGPDDGAVVPEGERLLRDGGELREPVELQLKRLDGTTFHAEIVGTRLQYDASPASLIIARDVSKRKKSEQLVEYMAYHDALTGLPNRLQFYKLVAARLHEGIGAMLFIDLDRFKLINDTLGHRTGDQLLTEVSARLKRMEHAFVSRQGGDEFTAYFPGADRREAERAALSILALLSEPYHIDGHELYVTPSIGISLYPSDSDNVDTLVQQADAALYEAKDVGGNAFTFFSTETEKSNILKLTLGNDLRKALANGELLLYYQPKYDISNGRIVGAEALIRWMHKERGLISPDAFIPFAEETGLILPIGEWVLRSALSEAKSWHNAGHRIAISVNLSVRQFLQHSFIEQIKAVLKETGLEPRYLNLEITESVPLLDFQAAVAKLTQVRALGVTISLDDFGTGYSSLNYIRRLPFDYLKIDKSFVQHMHGDAINTSIVRSVIDIAHLMGKRVVAEGVETAEHLRILEQSDCDEAQGYYLSRPVESGAFEQLLNAPLQPRS